MAETRAVSGSGREPAHGIRLADRVCMTAHALLTRVESGLSPESTCLLRWTFSQDGRSITCQLEADPSTASYYVCLVPHWSVSSAAVERARRPADAFRRHAELAMRLRSSGWSLVRHTH